MSADTINLSARRRPTGPSSSDVSIWRDPSKAGLGIACFDYLRASTQVEVLRAAAVKLGWIVPEDPRQAIIKMATKLFLLGKTMAEAIPHFAPDLAREEPPQNPPVGRRPRSKPKPTG